jgi:hypothetical protein
MNSAKRQKAFAESFAKAGGQLQDAFVAQYLHSRIEIVVKSSATITSFDVIGHLQLQPKRQFAL